MPDYKVTTKDGTVISKGDAITGFRGVAAKFEYCDHPRKIQTSHGEYFPAVFDLVIHGSDGYRWPPASETGS